MGLFSNLFKTVTTAELKEKISHGAVLLDVRTKEEFQAEHAKGAINIPLDSLPGKISTLKKDKPIVSVCASGMRSSSAVHYLKQNGFEVYNGKCWHYFRNNK